MKGNGFFFFNHEDLFSMQLGVVISHYRNISKWLESSTIGLSIFWQW